MRAKDQREKKWEAHRRHPLNLIPGGSMRERHQHASSPALDRSSVPGAAMIQSPVSAQTSPF
jgi:hypothetical protein